MTFYKELLTKRNSRNELPGRVCSDCVGGNTTLRKIVWRKPGACHTARFCSFGIYSLKALAFAHQFDWDDETTALFKQFCSFISTIYIPYFLASSIGCDAAINDLGFYKKLFAYRSSEPQLAEESLVVLRRHGWYLTPKVAMFSLFSEKLSTDVKSRVACKLLSMKASTPESYKLEEPRFPVITEKTELVDMVTQQSSSFSPS